MALAGDGPSLEQRLELAAEHTYDSRMRKMLHDLQRVGLLDAASGGPSMLRPEHRVWPLQQVLVPALFRSVRLRNRFGRSEAGRQLLRWFDGHHPVDPRVLDAQIPPLIQSMQRRGPDGALMVGARSHRSPPSLLFRGCRPKSLEEQILFETLGNGLST